MEETTSKEDWLTKEIAMKVRKHARHINIIGDCFVDAADIEQDLFLEICKAMRFFDNKRGNANAFIDEVLRRRSKNYLRDHLTLKRGKNIFFESIEANEANGKKIADKNCESAELIIKRIDFTKAVKKLSSPHLRIYILMKRYSIIDIARILKIPYASLHLEVQKIRDQLKQHINFKKISVNGEYILKGVNMKNLEILEKSSAKEISELEICDLMDLSHHMAKLLNHAKELKEKLEDGLNLRFSEAVKNNLRNENKDTGMTRFFDGAFQIVADVPKKVAWDSEKMEEFVKRIPEDTWKSFVKISYAIDERKYSSLPFEYQELFKEARTITPGKARYHISIGDQA